MKHQMVVHPAVDQSFSQLGDRLADTLLRLFEVVITDKRALNDCDHFVHRSCDSDGGRKQPEKSFDLCIALAEIDAFSHK